MGKRKNLAEWIGDELGSVGERQERCNAFSVRHYNGTQQVELKTIELGNREWVPKELEKFLLDIAETHAGGLPGIQQYQVCSFYENSTQPNGFYPLRLSGGDIAEGMGGLATEPPTATGHMMQMMRHNEAHMRSSFLHQEAVMDRMLNIIDRQGGMIDKLMTENHDAIDACKEVIMAKAADRHEKDMEILHTQRNSALVATAAKYLPAITNVVTGREIFPQSLADTVLLEGLTESMTQEQAIKLMGILDDKQKALLLPRMNEIIDKRAKTEEAQARAEAQANANGKSAA